VALWLVVVGGLVALAGAGAAARTTTTRRPSAALPVGAAGSPSAGVPTLPPSVRSPLIGAYYSDWFPSNSTQGTLRQHLVPDQGGDPTRVDSADPRVAEQAITQASRSGIDFFALDWWPSRPKQDQNVDAFVRARNLGDIKFCILYETWDLGFQPGNESTPVTPGKEFEFDENLLSFARKYFANPSYLRIGGRPVVVLYLSRTLTGDVSGMINGARALLRAHGYNPYLIGDEISWRVTDPNEGPDALSLTQTPQVSRLALFDAITDYTLYAGGPPDPLSPEHDFDTYPGQTDLVRDEVGLYRTYEQATGGWIPVIPDVMPGLNTRGVRLQADQHAQPRQWLPGAASGSTLQQYLDQIAEPVLEPSLPMIFVTSWNEWNEDTAVQPVGGVTTSRDDSASGTEYTQGYTYGGEGSTDLHVIRNFADAAFGRVTGASGGPVADARVVETAGGRPVDSVRTDQEGYYVMPRTGACPTAMALSAVGRSRTYTCSSRRSEQVDFHA
jgi:glycoprotein endo-alpha-1,2-mannosidase